MLPVLIVLSKQKGQSCLTRPLRQTKWSTPAFPKLEDNQTYRFQEQDLYERVPGRRWLREFVTDTLKLEDKTFILRQIWHLGPSLTPTTRFKSHLFGLFFLTGTLLVKYDNHKRACVRRAPINALSAFSWLSIRSRRQQQGSLIWREWGGGLALSTYGPAVSLVHLRGC